MILLGDRSGSDKRPDAMPSIPSKASIKASLRKYSIEAHMRGAHRNAPKAGCPACGEGRR